MNSAPEHRCLMVRASAGAGKTYALSNQYLELLAQGCGVASILATTFTRTAAGEIAQRVLERLALAARDDAYACELARVLEMPTLSRDHFRKLLRETADSLDRLSIVTIDGFFNRVATGFRHELGVPAGVSLVGQEDPVARELRMEAIDAMLGDADPQVLIDLIRRLHHDDASRGVTAAIDGIVSNLYELYLEAPHEQVWSRLNAEGEMDRAELAEAIERLRLIGDELPAVKRFVNAWTNNRKAAEEGRWDDFIGGGLTSKLIHGEKTFCKKAIPDSVIAAYEPLIQHARAAAVGSLARMTRATFELLQRFNAHYGDLRRRRRVLLYSDQPRLLADRFSQPDESLMLEVYFRLDAQIQHLLLDEFQDTSLLQWRVLEPLAGEICLNEDPARTFFCVGDVKQAIYGWRGGCAEVFDLAQQSMHLPPDSVTTNDENYRSSQVILDCVQEVIESFPNNPALQPVRKDAMAWAERFKPHTAKRAKTGYVELCSSPTDHPNDEQDDEDGEQPLGTHDHFVAAHVAEIAKAARGCSIGVLVMRNKTVQPLVHLIGEQLAKIGLAVTVSGESGNPLTDDPAVDAMLAAFTLADHPGDAVARFHVEHSPLAAAANLDDDIPRWSLRLRQVLLNHGYAHVIRQWTDALTQARACNRRNLQRLAQFIELADRYDPTASLRTSRFVEFVRQTPVEEPTPAPIRVMTIHKSKGLEFDAVVLPQLDKLLANVSRNTAWVYRETPTAPVTAIYRGTNKATRALSPDLQTAYDQERSRRVQDDLSSLYVAMTRARRALYMIVPPMTSNKDGKRSTKGWTNLTFAAILRQSLSEWGEDEGGEEGRVLSFERGLILYHAGDPQWHAHLRETGITTSSSRPWPPGKVVLSGDIGRRRRSWPRVTPSSLESGGAMGVGDLLAVRTSPAASRGQLLHAFFQQVAWLDEPGGAPDDQRLRQAAEQHAPNLTHTQVAEYLHEFQTMLAQPDIHAALCRGTDHSAELWRERPFAVYRDSRLLQGIFDRVVIRRNARHVCHAQLIDFKTDHIQSDDPADLEAHVARYRPQLHAYRDALATILGIPHNLIQTTLLFVAVGRQVHLD